MQITFTAKKMKRVFRWVLWVLLVQFVLLNISAALHAYRFTHFYDDPSLFQEDAASGNIFRKTWRLFAGSKYAKSLVAKDWPLAADTVILHTANGIKTESWYSRNDAARGTVIIFHGITANKSYMRAEAEALYKMGFSVMLMDLRAHGNSEGTVSTYGVVETEEVKMAYEFVKSKGEKNIFLYGISMGGVVVAKAVPQYKLEPAGVILEAPFATLQEHFVARARNLGFPGQPSGFLITLWAGLEQGFNGFKHKTTTYVRDLHSPVLLQYGMKDTYVSQKETDRIFEHIASTEKKLVTYEEAGHGGLLQTDPVTWLREMENFLSAHRFTK